MIRTWEVLRLLEEDVDKKFICKYPFGGSAIFSVVDGYYHFEVFDTKGKLKDIIKNPIGGGFNDNIRLSLSWEEVKQPVTWQEAIQAWATKKTVSMIDRNGTEWIYDDTKAMEFVEEEILYGTWYIK